MCMGLLGFQILRPICTSPGHFHTTLTPPPTIGRVHTVCVYVCLYVLWEGGGDVLQYESDKGVILHHEMDTPAVNMEHCFGCARQGTNV